ncbi:Fic family protein [Methanobrevibacter filiformis]|uniref:Adenosine monophosphate-protein transferase SoFic n=1 Tax=Methanobrevibacter filiformis TaxID=55758 RepID=A0A166C3C4_9EURY|nr:Fic family protein [Methanobrevibacter filiformis]KZX10967.1 adenosine monophosphate-protein transferase SoFic [Methanobrevibacter filiformis]
MDYNSLIEKRDFVKNNIDKLDKILLEKYTTNFEINFTHDSTAIEGNTLTLLETKIILEDKISVGSKELIEIYEVVNHDKAWNYVKECIYENEILNETIIKNIHKILMENILEGGVYRDVEVVISGAKHKPPSPFIANYELEEFYKTLKKNDYNNIAIAAYTHGEFVKIHPFIDGNGRTSRIIMNYQLIKSGFLPISIKVEDKSEYYNVLEEYATNNNLEPLIKLIYKLEEKELDFYIKAISPNF